jgi:sugar/nucleoside kinase (ribokinase family)
MVINRQGILAAGNWIVDHVKLINAWPAQDSLAYIGDEYRGTGGSPFNILVGLKKLGAKFPLFGAGVIGQDEPGEWIRETCRQQGIDDSLLGSLAKAPTSYTDVMTVGGSGRRTFFHQKGANAWLDADMIDLNKANAKLFHLGYLLLLDQLDQPDNESGTRAGRLLAEAVTAGFITSIDLVSEDSARFSNVVLPALPHVDLLFMNEFEATRSTSCEIRPAERIDPVQLLRAADALLAAGVKHWVIIHFPEGVFAASPQGRRIFQPSLRLGPEQVVGAVGAGDALAAGVLLGYHESFPIERCLTLGVCAAASCLSHASCTDGIQSLEDCLALATKFGFLDPIEGMG